jgi:hypothetical protein
VHFLNKSLHSAVGGIRNGLVVKVGEEVVSGDSLQERRIGESTLDSSKGEECEGGKRPHFSCRKVRREPVVGTGTSFKIEER